MGKGWVLVKKQAVEARGRFLGTGVNVSYVSADT